MVFWEPGIVGEMDKPMLEVYHKKKKENGGYPGIPLNSQALPYGTKLHTRTSVLQET